MERENVVLVKLHPHLLQLLHPELPYLHVLRQQPAAATAAASDSEAAAKEHADTVAVDAITTAAAATVAPATAASAAAAVAAAAVAAEAAVTAAVSIAAAATAAADTAAADTAAAAADTAAVSAAVALSKDSAEQGRAILLGRALPSEDCKGRYLTILLEDSREGPALSYWRIERNRACYPPGG